ncbi:peptidylprolyl isomerase [Sphingomonas immobilis]|uniref:peptidylprolyl isomerase n=1 Tax=Sphingomonas immobilis TaxID=3063997 RepID=A0ABT8ZXQ1_9SPHN|nr:peptidylprolyl isomerase [Sphingomonas sp. CA1-15]MDO7842350.1 peptidylprolyl isomerase [Sphingomonas sp. CA1-15]
MRFLPPILAALLLTAAAPASEPSVVRVRLETSAGPIVLAIDVRHAPITAKNFLAYVDDGRLDGTSFYRAARKAGQPGLGFVQGGIGTDARRRLDILPLEPTSQTGLRHVDGAISMARYAATTSGSANFSMLSGPAPNLDARPGFPGYAVFGKVAEGMDVVKRILAMPTAQGGDGAFKGQLLVKPVTILHAVRIDGTPKPTGRPQMWKMFAGK